ncbi:glycoside hydrolase family 3 C-terminal domain-containing protein [Peribacillus psychrosaccharolyticus]|uniref:glycoside hydrolase family 3 protein n=1 Tax=Peribacillus psychrosaccharolyticus TaxID=1407 RepID=UPI003D2E7AEF
MNHTDTYLFQNPEALLEDRVNHLVSLFTLEEKINLMCQYQEEIPRLGVCKYKHGTEGAHGIAWLGKATVFPQNIGLACTWNEELMKKVGSVIADEARIYYQQDPEKNGLTIWAPTVDMERDPRWGRTEEAYGEDPYLTGRLTTELIKGMQGDHPKYLKAAATLKHFLGNNNEVDRGECSVSIDPRNMREYYLKAFEMQIKEGKAQSIMTAYNAVNGTLCNMNPEVNKIIKQEWGMDGFVVSDAGDVLGSVNEHHYVESYAMAVALSIKNGIDSITDDQDISLRAIRDALEQGWLQEEDLDRALRNTFRVRFRLGEFDPDELNPYSNIPEEKLASKENASLSLTAAREGIVLLKNDSLLPLTKQKTAVLGPLANEVYTDWYSGTPPYMITPLAGIQQKLDGDVLYCDGSNRIKLRSKLNGQYIRVDPETKRLVCNEAEAEAETFIYTDWGWGNKTLRAASNHLFVTIDDDGCLTASAAEAKGWFVKEVFHTKTVNEGIQLFSWDQKPISMDEIGSLLVQGNECIDFSIEIVENGIETAVEAAKSAETAIVFVGNNPFINGKECVDREDITLPPQQETLIQEVMKVNPNTVVVMVGSYPFAVNWIQEHVPAVLYTSHAGQELGRAVTDVVFGEYNPAGRVNMTWYSSIKQLPDLMDYDIIKGKRTYQYFDSKPLYPFGHGLSYTTFSYRDLLITKESMTKDEKLTVTVSITNNGERKGDEVVQLYVRADRSRVKRALKTLKGFKRISLEPGESKQVTFELNAEDLAFWDVTQDRYCVEDGRYTIMIGSSSQTIILEKKFTVAGEQIPPRSISHRVNAINYDDYQEVFLAECTEGGHSIRNKDGESWITFHEVELSKHYKTIKIRAANGGQQAELEVRRDSVTGPLLCACTIPPTGGYQAWTTVEEKIAVEQDSIHDLYLVFKGEIQLAWMVAE